MEPITTNIFCLIGKPGSGKETILHKLISDTEFSTKYNINKLIYGTTRPMREGEIDGYNYHFFTKKEFDNIDPKEFIESRSYDNIYINDIYWYFTLKRDIVLGNNYIAKVSTFQYSEFKRWAFLSQLENSMHRIHIYPVMIEAPIFERVKRLIEISNTEQDIYNMCSKLITEQFEFKTVVQKNPELIDILNKDTCIIDNSYHGELYIKKAILNLKSFIINKISTQR